MIVVWPDGSVAIVRAVGVFPEYYRFTVNLGLAPARLGHMVGLLGDADGGIGNHLDDLVTRGGQPVTFPEHAVRRAVRHVHQQLADQQRRVAVRLRPGRDHRDVHRPDLPRRAGDAADRCRRARQRHRDVQPVRPDDAGAARRLHRRRRADRRRRLRDDRRRRAGGRSRHPDQRRRDRRSAPRRRS